MENSAVHQAWQERMTLLRQNAPLVQCITNTVVQQLTANVLLACGTSPAMVDHPDEAGVFAGVADAVLINLGTIAPHQVETMPIAARAAVAASRPWVLDPVAVGALPVRTPLAEELLEVGPTAIRANASEIIALAGHGAGGRGADSTAGSDQALEAASDLSRRSGAVVAVSGESDLIVSAERRTRVSGGDPLLTLVTGTGCSLGALTAAALGAAPEQAHDAVVASHALMAAAGSLAAREASGPGSFAVALLDHLGTLDAAAVASVVRVEEV